MAKLLKLRRGTDTQHASFTTGEIGEITVNTTNNSIHVHDGGTTTGGTELARADLSNVDGNLSNDLGFGDSVKATFGASNDLEIYHNGNNSFIEDSGTGDFYIRGADNVRIQSYSDNEDMAKFIKNGAAELYYDNAQKLATKSDGIDVTGEVQCDSLDIDGAADISGQLTLHDHLDLQDNDIIKCGTSDDLQIYHDGSSNYVTALTGDLYIQTSSTGDDVVIRAEDDVLIQVQKDTGVENAIVCHGDGSVFLYHNNSTKLTTTSSGIDVTGSVTCDGLTCAGDAQIEASTGILTLKDTDNTGSANVNYIRGRDSGNSTRWYLGHSDGGSEEFRVYNNANSEIIFGTNGSSRAKIQSDGHFSPASDDTYDLGTSSLQWRNAYFDGTVNCDGLSVDGTAHLQHKVYSTENTATASAFDLNNGNFWTFGAIAVPNPTNQTAGMSGLLRVTAAPTSFAANWKFPGGSYTAPTSFPAVAPFFVQASGTILVGNWTEGIA